MANLWPSFVEEFDNAAWTKDNLNATTPVIADTIAAPNGTTTADKLVENTANSGHSVIRASPSFSAATQYTMSAFFKAAERGFCMLFCSNATTAFRIFNLSDGSLGVSGGTLDSSGTIAYQNGWWRCYIVWTPGAGSKNLLHAMMPTNSSAAYTGDNSSGLYVWGAYLNAGSAPEEYPGIGAYVIPGRRLFAVG